MSIPVFILRAFWITPQVMLRFLPVLIAYVMISVGLFFTTDNPWVIGLILFMLGTLGYAFLVVQGLRAALQALKLTSAPTASGLLRSSGRMLFVFFLLQLLMLLLFGGILLALFYYVIFPAIDPALVDYLHLLVEIETSSPGTLGPEGALQQAEQVQAMLDAQTSTGIMLLNFSMYLLLGFVMALFGVPMAAVAANAVQYSPNHDLIYGLGRYMPHQVLLYMLLVALPSALFGHLPMEMLLTMAEPNLATLATLGGVVLLYGLFAMCLPWSGMALAYGQVREKVKRERQAEVRPEIDYEAARADLRSLRQTRTSERSGTTMYDPNAVRRDMPPADG